MRKSIAVVLVAVVMLSFVAVPKAEAKGGLLPCIVGVFIGPRAGYQFNEGVGVRLWEILDIFIPPLIIIDWIKIFSGTTWTEIVQQENLTASGFDSWHQYAAVK